MVEPLMRLDDISVEFPIDRKHTLKAVSHVSLAIRPGETVGLVGESGCGKTTLGRAAKGIYPVASGVIHYKGTALTHMTAAQRDAFTREVQMIFQDPYSSLDPRMTVRDIILEGMRAHRMSTRAERFARADELLEVVGLSREHGNRFPHEFSGGQRQRIGIARALALNPEFIVCDEPTSALDVSIQAQVITLLKDLQRRLNLTYLFISHDLAMVKYVSDRIVVMYLGEVVEIAPSDRLYESPLHPYTRSLISSIQVADPIVEASRRRIRLTGDIPNPMDVAGVGCKFRSRCPNARLGCAAATPELHEIAPGHFAACTIGAPEGGLTL